MIVFEIQVMISIQVELMIQWLIPIELNWTSGVGGIIKLSVRNINELFLRIIFQTNHRKIVNSSVISGICM